MLLHASVVVLVFMGLRRLLFTSFILAASKSLRIFNITKLMAAKRSQLAMLKGNTGSLTFVSPVFRCCEIWNEMFT